VETQSDLHSSAVKPPVQAHNHQAQNFVQYLFVFLINFFVFVFKAHVFSDPSFGQIFPSKFLCFFGQVSAHCLVATTHQCLDPAFLQVFHSLKVANMPS